MGRRIVTQRLQNMGEGAGVDTYFDKVVKYIPADIVAGWTGVTGLVANPGTANTQSGLLWSLFVVFIVLTPLWTRKQTKEAGRPIATTQIAISTAAFIVWVFALGGPFATLGFYQPLYGSLLLIIYTLTVGLVTPPEDTRRNS